MYVCRLVNWFYCIIVWIYTCVNKWYWVRQTTCTLRNARIKRPINVIIIIIVIFPKSKVPRQTGTMVSLLQWLWWVGSFRSGNADVRLYVSCANFGSWHSYELEPLCILNSIHYGNRQKNKIVREVRRSWRISQSETFPGEGIHSFHALHVHTQYTAELRRSFAKALVSHNDPKNAIMSRLVASCFVLRNLPSIIGEPYTLASLRSKNKQTNKQTT